MQPNEETNPPAEASEGLWLYWCDVDGYTTSRCSCETGTSQGVRYRFPDWDTAVIAAKERRQPTSPDASEGRGPGMSPGYRPDPDSSGERPIGEKCPHGVDSWYGAPCDICEPNPAPDDARLTDDGLLAEEDFERIGPLLSGMTDEEARRVISSAAGEMMRLHMQAQVDAAEAEKQIAVTAWEGIKNDLVKLETALEAAQAEVEELDTTAGNLMKKWMTAQEQSKRLAEAGQTVSDLYADNPQTDDYAMRSAQQILTAALAAAGEQNEKDKAKE